MRSLCFLMLFVVLLSFVLSASYKDIFSDNGIDLDMEDAEDVSYDEEKGVLSIDGFEIDMQELERYQSSEEGSLGSYEFNGESYEKSNKKISSVFVDGGNVVFEYEDGATASFLKSSKFDLLKRRITLENGDEFDWMGEGKVEVKKRGEIELGFVQNEDDSSDLKNFAILKNDDGRVFSQFQGEVMDEFDVPSDVEKPSGGAVTFKKGGKVYSLDSNGDVRLIEPAVIRMDEEGLSSVDSGMVDSKNGRLFAFEKFSFSEVEGNYVLEEENNLKIVSSEGKSGFFYEIKNNLEVLDVKGDGVVRNGDKVLLYQDKDISLRKIDSRWSENGGEFLYTVERIIAYDSASDSRYDALEISKDDDGEIKLFEYGEDEPIDEISLKGEDVATDDGEDESGDGDGGVKGGDTSSDPIEAGIHKFVNDARGGELKWDENIAKAAREHSRDMAGKGSIGHWGFSQRLRAAGCSGGSENVASFSMRKISAEDAGRQFTRQWLGSSGHRANIMSQGNTRTGIGVVKTGSGYYATQIFC